MNVRQANDPEKPVIVLVRHDLRISDNGTLAAAAASGKPALQGEKFDSDGSHVRRYVPELRKEPASPIHTLQERTACAVKHCEAAGSYPEPIIDHRLAHERALNAYKVMRGEA